MKRTPLIFLLSLMSLSIFAQHRKFGYVELGGTSVFTSLNFDMRFNKENPDGLGFRAGAGSSFGAFDIDKIYTVPVGINYVIGKGKSGFIVGGNSVFAINGEPKGRKSENFKSVIFSADVGYRYTPTGNGFGFQATYTPLFNTVDGTMPFWIGVGIGYSWN
ncbi:hypothetical protein [Sphingobacterium deserti]|uniref:Outer membrane protein beta-barrel domain-containing protein n=1 Tax=Sphingobacterium deserti TaxID=1229276 RepID=A0A0B8T1I9_9SPHI|nr:hypothetical protein [Sphingobacterium deserti]KGE14872.1 hypothetical protein DI53_1372 [Sphingobacterium deserti]